MKSKILEADITKAIRKLLRQHGIFHFKHFGGFAGRKGVSDILGIYKARFLAIEVKRPGNKLTDAQVKFLKEVSDNGGIALVAHSTEEVIKALHLPDLYEN